MTEGKQETGSKENFVDQALDFADTNLFFNYYFIGLDYSCYNFFGSFGLFFSLLNELFLIYKYTKIIFFSLLEITLNFRNSVFSSLQKFLQI